MAISTKLIRLDDETHALLKSMSVEDMRPMAQVIRKALRDSQALKALASR